MSRLSGGNNNCSALHHRSQNRFSTLNERHGVKVPEAMIEEIFRVLPEAPLRAFQHHRDESFAAALGGGNKVEQTAVNTAGFCRLSCFDADGSRVIRQQNVGVLERALPSRAFPGIIFLADDTAKFGSLQRRPGD